MAIQSQRVNPCSLRVFRLLPIWCCANYNDGSVYHYEILSLSPSLYFSVVRQWNAGMSKKTGYPGNSALLAAWMNLKHCLSAVVLLQDDQLDCSVSRGLPILCKAI